MASAVVGLLLFATVGPDTAYFPTIFLACFAIGLGIGIAFMPLLTLAMADVPAADAGLGSGHHQRLPADQRRPRARRPQHRRRQPHEGPAGRRPRRSTSALIGGYQVAFLAGALTIAAGIVLAFALLRPRTPRAELQLAERPARAPTQLAMKEQAA